jgi:hypothetical protein
MELDTQLIQYEWVLKQAYIWDAFYHTPVMSRQLVYEAFTIVHNVP